MAYFMTALIPAMAVAVVVILAKRTASHDFICKHCSKSFRIKWPKVVITEHTGDRYKLVCPHCNTKDWCIKQPKNHR